MPPHSPEIGSARHIRRACRVAGVTAAVAIATALAGGPASAAVAPSGDPISRIPTTTYQTIPGGPIPLAAGGTVSGLPAWGDYPGAPPPFAVPTGGRATQTPAPNRREATVISLYLPDGSLYATGVLTAAGYDTVSYYDSAKRLVTSVTAERATLPAQTQTHFSENSLNRLKPAPKVVRRGKAGRYKETASCAATGYSVDSGYRLYTGTMPFYISTNVNNLWVNGIVFAADNWNSMQNWCGFADQSNIALNYAGRLAAAYGANGYNTVDYGPVEAFGGACNAPTIVGCNQRWVTTYPYLSEDDLRLDNGTDWNYNGGPYSASSMDVEGVTTHEFGHALGLEHVASGQTGEVMNPVIPTGSTSNRQLGRGDATWANSIY